MNGVIWRKKTKRVSRSTLKKSVLVYSSWLRWLSSTILLSKRSKLRSRLRRSASNKSVWHRDVKNASFLSRSARKSKTKLRLKKGLNKKHWRQKPMPKNKKKWSLRQLSKNLKSYARRE